MVLGELDWDSAVLTTAWAVVGVAMLGAGFAILDVLTPGRLIEKIRADRNPNAAVLAISYLVAVTTILVTAAATSSADDFGGLASAAGYAGIGLAVLAVVTAIYEQARRADLDQMFDDRSVNPLSIVMAVVIVSLGAVLAAALS